MEPADTIIQKLGGAPAVALACGIHRTRVYAWKRSRADGGTGGRIPQDHHRKLLDLAQSLGVELDANDFLPIENGDDSALQPAVAPRERAAS